ncbi:hypothetical protein Nepgr_019241 [Nepenthes gracilis]|uniref:Uncharacterized protein n=1 Tax=Nepenthes gracilis TaxID=150966 RepID=A0AAD3XV14_NEPGR|nr:hypothetical protein Nepgr_019241 [Nepenthes gracilis]
MNLNEYTSNRSSLGSAITNSASCAHFGGADASDFTGPFRSVALDTLAPSRKRIEETRQKPSSVEKLTIDFYAILPEQKSFTYLSLQRTCSLRMRHQWNMLKLGLVVCLLGT